MVNPKTLLIHPQNVKLHEENQLHDLGKLYEMVGFTDPIMADKKTRIVWAGNGSLREALNKEMSEVPVVWLPEDWDDSQKKLFMLMDNRITESPWIADNVEIILQDIPTIQLDQFRLNFDDIVSTSFEKKEFESLKDKFGVPPFSVFDTRQKYWQERKRVWLSLGIKSELGRDAEAKKGHSWKHLTGSKYQAGGNTRSGPISDISIFDPVNCEIMYKWFTNKGAKIVDPFAGGSVRGVVAGLLDRHYVGLDIAEVQIAANREQWDHISKKVQASKIDPIWITDDSQNVDRHFDVESVDFIFSCPPYFDLEVYSDDPRDLSNMDYPQFLEMYEIIIKKCARILKNNSFACFVVGDVRDKKGLYRRFVADTITLFAKANLNLYNQIVRITPFGTVGLRASHIFPKKRKVLNVHEHILVFYKGDPNMIEPIHYYEQPIQQTSPVLDLPSFDDDALPEITPIEEFGGHLVKRDDYFQIGGGCGGKVRTCWALSQGAKGLVTAGSRSSPQVNIVAQIARKLNIPCRVHTPEGELSPEVEMAKLAGATIIQHPAGYNNVIIARAREDAELADWTYIPFGMEHDEAVRQTMEQVGNIPTDTKRIVVPVGSGMSLAGILTGLNHFELKIPVLGVIVGADPTKRLDKYAPQNWREMVKLVKSDLDYHEEAEEIMLGELMLDPIYEAKCLPFLEPDDLLWVVGIRASAKSY